MVAFMIARIDVTDRQAAEVAYPAYLEAAKKAPLADGTIYLVRGGAAHSVEGIGRERNVVMQFSDMEAIRTWFFSDAYQAAKHHREAVSVAEFVAVEGTGLVASEANDGAAGKKGYLVARFDVRDAETYKDYVEAAALAFKEFEARFLARGGPYEALEGSARTRNVLIEFPSVERALACYHSPVYQAARRHRLPVSEGEVVILEGFERAAAK